MPSSRAIVVLGMHRSGTSVLTRGLQALGVELGNDFIEARFDNPTGYWENRPIHGLNVRLLGAFDLKWEDIELISDAQWRDIDLEPFRREAADHLRAHFLGHPIWGFKDPRAVLLLPFWQPLFDSLAVDTRYIVAIRNPLSVAASLRRRQNLATADSLLLWLLYTVPHLHRIADRPFVVVDYDRLLADPPAQFARIAQRLDLPVHEAQREALAGFARDFLQPTLRHHQFSPGDFDLTPRLGPASREAYLRLLQLAADQAEPDAAHFWPAWQRLNAAATDLINEAAERKKHEVVLRRQRREEMARFTFQSRPCFPDVQLFVVTGTQRTGSNLLRELLNTNLVVATVAEVLTPCAPPGHKPPEPPYPPQSEEEIAASYQLPPTAPGPLYPGLNHGGFWGNFLRTLPGGVFPAETPAQAEALLDRYFAFLLDLIRSQWVGGDKKNVRAIGVDIKYSHLYRLAPRPWLSELPSFLLGYLRARGAVLIHGQRGNVVQCTVSALSVQHTGACHNYAHQEMDRRFAVNIIEFLEYARRVVREREAFRKGTESCRVVEYEYEDLSGELARADAATGDIAPGDGPLRKIAEALGVPYQFVYNGRLQKTINVPYSQLLSNRDELMRALEKTEFAGLAATLT